jgi:hypothetical protein
LPRLNSDFASLSERVASIEEQISDHTAELVSVHPEFWLQAKLLHDVYFRRAV